VRKRTVGPSTKKRQSRNRIEAAAKGLIQRRSPDDFNRSRRSAFACGLEGRIDFLAVTCNDAVEFLLELAQNPREIDGRKVPLNMLVHNFDEREQFG